MLIKTLLIILTCSTSLIYGQSSNTAANAAKGAAEAAGKAVNKAMDAVNRAANTNNKNAKPLPTQTPIPNNTTIRGKVFFEDDGKPLRRSVLVFFKTGVGREQQTLTDENGNFEIRNMMEGSYYPMILSSGIVNFFSSIDFEKMGSGENERDAFKDAMQNFQEIKVDGKTNLEVKIPIKHGGSISGIVTYSDGSPATGRSIQVLRKVNGKLQPVLSNFSCLAIIGVGSGICNETDDRGWYRFVGLPAGEYFIRVNEPAIHGRNSLPFLGGPDTALGMMFGLGAFLNTYYPNTIEANQAEPIKIDLGKEKKDANITIPDWKLYKISGKLVSERDGKPVKSKIYIVQKNELTANITPANFNQYRSSVETDENGNWIFNEIPRGNYTLLIEPYSKERLNFISAANAAAFAANAIANAANTVMNAVGNASKVSNLNLPKSSPTPNLPTDFAKMSKNLIIENSNLENVEIKVNTAAWVLGTVIVPPKTESEGRLKITAFDENDISIESDYIYLASIKSDKNKNLTKTFEIKGLPKGKIKMKFELSNASLEIKTATVNGVDLLNNFIELKEGQVLSNVKVVLEKKQ